MAENIEDLTVNYEEEGILVVQEIDKEILSKGSWTTILFQYRDFDKTTQQYSSDKFTIRRYQKRNGQYQAKSKFNISSITQAEKIVETLSRWIKNQKTWISHTCPPFPFCLFLHTFQDTTNHDYGNPPFHRRYFYWHTPSLSVILPPRCFS